MAPETPLIPFSPMPSVTLHPLLNTDTHRHTQPPVPPLDNVE